MKDKKESIEEFLTNWFKNNQEATIITDEPFKIKGYIESKYLINILTEYAAHQIESNYESK